MSSDDESDSMSETSVTLENGAKKIKLHEKENNKMSINKDKKIDLMQKTKEKSLAIGAGEVIKDVNSKEVKTTTVKDMLRAQRDANMLKTSSHINNKRSKSTSSATSDDSSSSDSDSSDTSSDADRSRHSDDDDIESVEHKAHEKNPSVGIEHATPSNASSAHVKTIQMNGVNTMPPDNIPSDSIDPKLLDNLSTNTRELITKLIEHKHLQSDTLPELLYEYVPIQSDLVCL